MSDDNLHAGNGDDDLKRKLVRRVAFAGLLIALLLGALAFIDHLGRPSPDEPTVSGPVFTSPVPVARKDVSQPVKPAVEPTPPEAPKEPVPPPPPVVEAPTAAPAAPPPTAVQSGPPKHDIRSTPQTGTRASHAISPTQAEGTSAASSQFMPEPERPAVAPARPRLFSGFAVQAGIFSDAEQAEELRARLALNGIPSNLETRVQVGPFKTREEAEAARQKMKALGVDGILLQPKGVKR